MLIDGEMNHFFLPGVNILSNIGPDQNGKSLEEAGRWLKTMVQNPSDQDDFRVDKAFLDKFLPSKVPEARSQKKLFSLFGPGNSFDKEDATEELSNVFLKLALSMSITRILKEEGYKLGKIR